jgi:hypothetical protein
MPLLTRVDGTVSLFLNAVMKYIDFPELTLTINSISLNRNPQMTYISLPKLTLTRAIVCNDNNALKAVDLSSLTFISREFSILRNAMLAQIVAHQLAFVGWVVDLPSNVAVTSILLPALTMTGHHISMGNHAELLFVDLSSLQIVLGDFFAGHLTPKLTSCDLPELLSIPTGYLSFFSTGLTRFYAPKLTHVNGGISLTDCPSMTSIIMPSLTMSGHNLDISSNAELLFVDLSSLQVVLGEYFKGHSTPKLLSCDLPELLSIPTGYLLFITTGLTRFYAPKLTHVNGGISLTDCPSITSIIMPSLTMSGHRVHLGENGELLFVDLSSLQIVLGDYLYGHNNPKMTSCDLPELLSVPTGDLSFYITSLTRFYAPKLTRVGASLTISDNSFMTSITLTSLAFAGGDFAVFSNALLTMLSIPALASVTGNVYICSNGDLPLQILPESVRVSAQQCALSAGACPLLSACPSN